MNRIEQDKKTVAAMIDLFCAHKHQSDNGLCTECSELKEYAMVHLENCHYQNNKPVCSLCPVHCYKPGMRARIKDVMRFSGPRMILFHPVLAVQHLINKAKSKSNNNFNITDIMTG